MFLLKYLFNIRNKSVLDEEKPFLHHLEDLRSMLFKTIITIIVSMILCFNFADTLLDFLRKPVDEVWDSFEKKHLPSEIQTVDWVLAKQIADTSPGLTQKARLALLKRESPEVQKLVEAYPILKAARLLPLDEQNEFIVEAVSSPEIEKMIQELEKSKALIQNGEMGKGAVKMMSALQPAEGFNLSIKLAFYAGLIVSFPLLMLFLLEFIVPGLKASERKTLYKSIAIGFGLFLAGASFAFFVVLPQILDFFFDYSMKMGISNDWRIGFYLSFALQFIFLFGLSFELPVVVMPFVKLGIINYDMMKGTRRYAIVIIAILSAVLTPQDVISMLMMGVPMYILYEICIYLAWRHSLKVAREEEAERTRIQSEWSEGNSVYQQTPNAPKNTTPQNESEAEVEPKPSTETSTPPEPSPISENEAIYTPAPLSEEDKDILADSDPTEPKS